MTSDKTEDELTELDDKIIGTINSEFKRPEEITEITGLPIAQVMKRLRELTADGLVVVKDTKYGIPVIANKALKLLNSEENFKKTVGICGFALLELFAILGTTIPLSIEYVYRPPLFEYGTGHWDLKAVFLLDYDGVLVGFLISAALLTILYVRNYLRISSTKIQVIYTVVVVGVLLGTIFGIKALS